MFGYGKLWAHERNDLLRPCLFWLRKVPKEDVQSILQELVIVFHKWKLAQADADGKVAVVKNALATGLLGYEPNPKPKRYSLDEVTVHQVAGPFVENDIDLAFKLWLDNYSPFNQLLEKRGIATVFAVIGASSGEEVGASSLIRLNGFLGDHIATFATVVEEAFNDMAKTVWSRARKDAAQREAARLLAVQARKEKRAQRDQVLYREAVDYFTRHPRHEVEDAAAFLASKHRLAHSTVEKKIKGAKAEAMKALEARQQASQA